MTFRMTRALCSVIFASFCLVQSVIAFSSMRLASSSSSLPFAKRNAFPVKSGRPTRTVKTTTTTTGTIVQMSSDTDNIPSEQKDLQNDSNDERDNMFQPVFDFTTSEGQNGKDTVPGVTAFERIDDAIMGGISTSSLRQGSASTTKNDDGSDSHNYGIWSGVCRIDGGGFCGTRTLPFTQPLDVGDADGFYMDCALMSDNEPNRRVWKMVTRTDTSRGEQVYQASFTLPPSNSDEEANTNNDTNENIIIKKKNQEKEWTRVKVPFASFQQVRGPRLVVDGPSLNVTGGLYQFGLSMSKFQIASNTTELPNFRPGYFELHIQQIGLYTTSTTTTSKTAVPVKKITPAIQTLSEDEAKQKRPVLFKIVSPVLKLFFSEQSNRRRSVMKILREQRGYTRMGAIMYGIRSRINPQKKISSTIRSIGKTLYIAMTDAFRTVAKSMIRFGIFYPLKLTSQLFKLPFALIARLQKKNQN